MGLEPSALTPEAQDAYFLRMVPFVVRNYNMVELGPRGTGKSHLFQQVSPYAYLLSGGRRPWRSSSSTTPAGNEAS